MKLFLFCVAVLLLSGCASQKIQGGGIEPGDFRSQKVEPEARSTFQAAERALAARNYEEARRLYLQLRTRHPKGKAAMVATYRLGSVHYYQEEYAQASREFEVFLARYPKSELVLDANYNLAACEFQQGKYERARQILQKMKPDEIKAQGPRRSEVIYALIAQSSIAMGKHGDAVRAISAQMQLPIEAGKRAALLDKAELEIAKMGDQQELDGLQNEVTEPQVRSRIASRLTQFRGTGPGELPLPPAGSIPKASAPDEVISPSLSGGGGAAEKTHIGVVLPLSGKFSAYGKRALDGILLASGTFARDGGSSIRVFVEDSGGNPITAQQAVEKLVREHKVIAILGPLSWKESLAVAEKAQQLGVLNLSLTGKEGISEKGPYLFQNALTPKVQLENLVQHCVQTKGYKRFAIMAPNNPYGKDMASQFWDLVEANGGKVVGYRNYAADEKDFQATIRELVGLANPRLRRAEWAKLQEFIKEQKAKTGKEPKVKLPPLITFDALFIPDGPKAAATIAASLNYLDVFSMPLIGTAEWNSDQLYRRGGRSVEGALFPGSLSMNTKNVSQREFIKFFTENVGNTPDLLATQAYEAMAMIVSALRGSGSGRNDIVNKLSAVRDFQGPLGSVVFDATRIARRKMPIYQLEAGGNIIEQN